MGDETHVVTMKGNPIPLSGNTVKVGDQAPDFTAVDNDLAPVDLASFRGKVCIISSVPSLDTPVCDLETKAFNEKASQLGTDVVILTISMDLPFAQKRWCAASGVDRVQTLSDHKDAAFGKAYGMLIEDLRLLARGIFVVDRDGVIQYIQVVGEITDEPDYDAIWQALDQIL